MLRPAPNDRRPLHTQMRCYEGLSLHAREFRQRLGERIRQLQQTSTDKQVFLRMDRDLTIEDQIDVFFRLKEAGVQNVGIPTALPGEQ